MGPEFSEHPPPTSDIGPAQTGKLCVSCGQLRPKNEFLRRTGRRAAPGSRRGLCRVCRLGRRQQHASANRAEEHHIPQTAATTVPSERSLPEQPQSMQAHEPTAPPSPPKRRARRPLPPLPPRPAGPDASLLRPTRQGIVRMRGRTDKGRRWLQETDLETAVTLVLEHAAVVVNRHTIRRLYSNKSFRSFILQRDQYTCHFCGEYGDTIDHLLPRAKGGHTTPANCVCACNECNQSKADRTIDEFIGDD